MKKLLESAFGVTPNIAIAFVAEWVDLFRNTAILRPDVPYALVNTSLALSVFLSIVFVLVGSSWDAAYKLNVGKNLLVVAVILAVWCIGSRLYLNWPRSQLMQGMVTSMWDLCGCVFVVVAIMAVTFAAMFAISRTSGVGEDP